MTDLVDYWPPVDPAPAVEREPARCRRHRWLPDYHDEQSTWSCTRCGKQKDEAASRRGRNNRKRGNAQELTVARVVGGRKMGPLGLPWDVEIEGYMRLQVKKLARWPSLFQVVAWMDAIPIGPVMRAVALVQPGRGGRRLLVLDLDEFARWHGDPTEAIHD